MELRFHAEAASTVPSTVVPSVSNILTVPASSVSPLMFGVLSFVRLSLVEPVKIPTESEAVERSSAVGALGAVASIVTKSTADAIPVLPASSVAVALMS